MSEGIDWVYWDEAGAAVGPVGIEELAGLVRSGKIAPSTDLRRQSDVAWKPAAALLPDLFPGHAATPPASVGWTDVKPHPWRRYLARMFDALVVGSIAWTLIGAIAFSVAPAATAAAFGVFRIPGGQFIDIILTQLVVIPFNAVAIGLTGLTLGKWIFGVRVSKDGRPIGILKALQREAAVFLFGLGLGIPFASLFTLIGSYSHLRDDGATAWDRAAKLTVNYRPESRLATIGMAVAVILFLVARAMLLMAARTA